MVPSNDRRVNCYSMMMMFRQVLEDPLSQVLAMWIHSTENLKNASMTLRIWSTEVLVQLFLISWGLIYLVTYNSFSLFVEMYFDR